MKQLKDVTLTQDRLRVLLDYDPVTGHFHWKTGNGRRVSAGDRAGGLDAWGYIKITVDGQSFPAHRLVWLYVHGKFPSTTVKHKNGDNSDNRIANLHVLEANGGARRQPLTMDRVRELFDYDPLAGVLIWRVATSSRNPKGSVAGSIGPNGYRSIMADWQKYQAHRLVWLWHNGSFPPADIDHANGDRSDNRIENLRLANRSQNMSNVGRRRDNSSGCKGVSWHAQDAKWRACIQKDGKFIHIGLYDTKEEASAAYFEAAQRLQGEFARQ
jgi:hypothetical protein